MATVTAMIHVGMGHPNDDGLLLPSMKGPIFLQENSRPVWTHHEPHHHGCSLVPSKPETILEEGLMFVGIRLLGWSLSDAVGQAIKGGGKHNAKSLFHDDDARRETIDTVRRFSKNEGRKLIISVMHGSSLLSQLPMLEAWPSLEVEVLTPCFVRVSNRWLSDAPSIVGDLERQCLKLI